MAMLQEKITELVPETEDVSDGGRLLILLYNEAIGGLHEAAAAAEAGNVLERLDATVRVSEAVCSLHLGLDHERGGEIAANLDQLYRFIQTHVPRVNVDNDAALARRLAGLLEPLLDSWIEVIENAETGAPELPAGRAATLVELSDARTAATPAL